MKGKKLCIGLLIFFITSLLSLSLFSNANAIEKRKNIRNNYINSVVWFYQGKDAQGNSANQDQTANLINNTVLSNVDLYTPLNSSATLVNLRLNIRSNDTLTLSKNKYFKLNIYYQVEPEAFNSDLSIPICPRGQGNLVVDECKITHIENESQIYKIREELLNPSDNMSYSQVYNYAAYFYVMELIGHYEGNETTLSQLAFYNNFYTFYNSNAVLGHQKLKIFFSPIEQFEYVDSAEDEAAEKELEDRDNLETQSTNTDNQANTATQSAENTGSTLFAAFTQFFNALTNVSGSSCVLPTMQVYSLDLGQMDLCTFDIPPQIMALVSIGMVFIIVPLGVHLVKKMISLYKEITG